MKLVEARMRQLKEQRKEIQTSKEKFSKFDKEHLKARKKKGKVILIIDF